MIFELDDLLDKVDRWKLKLAAKLKRSTPARRAAFWQRARQKARQAGLRVVAPVEKRKTAKRGA
jgi:hypothetical protein